MNFNTLVIILIICILIGFKPQKIIGIIAICLLFTAIFYEKTWESLKDLVKTKTQETAQTLKNKAIDYTKQELDNKK